MLLGGVALWCIVGSISSMPAMRTPFWPLVTVVCLGTHVALPVLARADARRERARVAAAHDRALATLQCVRCGQWMQMHSGKAACPRCKSIIMLEFEEPRCECGYPLHRLNSANCPECGTGIPAEKRWLGGAPPADTLTPSST
jgi:Zn finger protein HypA/HybF involved in hydrogenase expression